MASITHKKIALILLLIIGMVGSAHSQDFYTDYRNKLLKRSGLTAERKRIIEASTKRLRQTTDQFIKEKGHSFFSRDTVYMIEFYGAETGFTSVIIWNRDASVYYHYDSADQLNWKPVDDKLKIRSDAKDVLKSFSKPFLQAIENGDTSAYHKYAIAHQVLDGEFVSPLMAIKANGHWRFAYFHGSGFAINYNLDIEPNE